MICLLLFPIIFAVFPGLSPFLLVEASTYVSFGIDTFPSPCQDEEAYFAYDLIPGSFTLKSDFASVTVNLWWRSVEFTGAGGFMAVVGGKSGKIKFPSYKTSKDIFVNPSYSGQLEKKNPRIGDKVILAVPVVADLSDFLGTDYLTLQEKLYVAISKATSIMDGLDQLDSKRSYFNFVVLEVEKMQDRVSYVGVRFFDLPDRKDRKNRKDRNLISEMHLLKSTNKFREDFGLEE